MRNLLPRLDFGQPLFLESVRIEFPLSFRNSVSIPPTREMSSVTGKTRAEERDSSAEGPYLKTKTGL